MLEKEFEVSEDFLELRPKVKKYFDYKKQREKENTG